MRGIKPRIFIEAISLAIAFFTFALVIAVVMDIEAVVNNPMSIVNVPINILYSALILASLLLFIFFTVSLFVRPLINKISELYKKPPFLQLLWVAIIIDFLASAIGSATQLSSGYRPVVIYILAFWPVIVALALIANLTSYNWKRLERVRQIIKQYTPLEFLGKILRSFSWFKQPSNLISVSFLVFALILLFRFAIGGSLFGGSVDSARYLLSALAQTQGAIIAIVISLTIVAVQISSQSYSLRITDLLLRYEFFWFMLFLYGLSIIYDVTLLSRINNDNIGSLGSEVNASLFIAAIVIWALFPYAKKTIERLRPQTIIRILGKHILSNDRGTFSTNRNEAIFPLFDATKKAVRSDDIATSRDGIGEIERVCCEILAEDLNEEDEKSAASYFCEQYQRTAKIAFAQNDIDSVLEISRSLLQIASNITKKELSKGRADSVISVSERLADIGGLAIHHRWEDVLNFVASSLGDLSVACTEWRIPDLYITDADLQGAKILSSDVIKNTTNDVLHLLMELNLHAISIDVLLAARNTKRHFMNACILLIEKGLDAPFYEKICVENIRPLVRAIRTSLGTRFDWISHIADVLTAIGIESVESLGKGIPESTLRDYLVWIVGTEPSEQPQISEDEITRTMAGMFNFINGVKGDAGAIWLLESFEGIGVAYCNKGYNLPLRSVITHLGLIGSFLGFENKLFTAELPRKALHSISIVLKSSHDERLAEYAFKAVFRIMAETDDKEAKEEASGIFKESSKTLKETAFKQTVGKCINEFKAENQADLQASAERRARLDRFADGLQI